METQTLKQLIDMEFERSSDISIIKKQILKYIELYENELDSDKKQEALPPLNPYTDRINKIPEPIHYENYCDIPYTVLYCEICSCNPKNGGSGICGCTMANKEVPNPKKTIIAGVANKITNINPFDTTSNLTHTLPNQ